MSNYHQPVMTKELLKYLDIKKGGWYIDCNLGGGGHTGEIIKNGGKVLGIDLDSEAILEVAKVFNLKVIKTDKGLRAPSNSLILAQSNFTKIDELVSELGIKDIKGVFFDLGVSSFQLDKAQRGFSFNLNAPLDMRMDQSFGATAADLVNGLHEGELVELFLKYGEESFAKKIAGKIIEERRKQKIDTTGQLADIVSSVKFKNKGDRTHPATKVFQSLRIAVNDEINSLKEVLPKAFKILDSEGRLVVISFHSLEDRIVKQFFKELADNKQGTLIIKKPIEAHEDEINLNPRSRSAKLRVIQKI